MSAESHHGLSRLMQGAPINADELGDYPPVFRDAGSSRVTRVQDILIFLQSPQMEVDRYRVNGQDLAFSLWHYLLASGRGGRVSV